MKQFARKSHALSILPPALNAARPQFETAANVIKKSFNGWLNAVQPIVASAPGRKNKAALPYLHVPPLTSTDTIRVDRATVRESHIHRHWPREVIEKFLAAEVITGK